MRWTEGCLAASQRPWRRRPRRGRSAWHACGWVSREPGRPRRLHRKDRRGAGTGSPKARGRGRSTWRPTERSRRCSDGTAGRRQRSAGGWTARSRRVSEYRRSGGIEPTRPRGGKGAPAGGTGGGKDGQHTEVGSRLHVTTPDSRTGQISLGDGGGHRLASWTSGYATARSEAICRGAGCGRTRTSGSVGGQGQQRPWSTRPRKRAVAHDVEAQFSTVVTPALGAGHPVDRVHRSSVPGGNPRFSPKISEVKATDQQRPAQAPRSALGDCTLMEKLCKSDNLGSSVLPG